MTYTHDDSGAVAEPGAEGAPASDARARELADLCAVVAAPEGRRLVWRLLDRAGVFRVSFAGPEATFFNEGMRNLGLMVFADLMEACPGAYLTMLAEREEDDDG